MDIKVTEVNEELTAALQEKQEEAIELLQVSETETPKEVVKKIREYADKLLKEVTNEDELFEYALQLGSLWGSMVVKQYNWTWKHLDFGKDGQGIYVVSPNAYYCCPPLYFLNKIMQSNNAGLDGKNDNTIMLLFNMIDGIENDKPAHKYQVIS